MCHYLCNIALGSSSKSSNSSNSSSSSNVKQTNVSLGLDLHMSAVRLNYFDNRLSGVPSRGGSSSNNNNTDSGDDIIQVILYESV